MALSGQDAKYCQAVGLAFGLPQKSLSMDDALGVLSVLQSVNFVIGSVDTVIHPSSGSLFVDSEVLAYFFSYISNDPIWWRAKFQSESFAGSIDVRYVKWLAILRANADHVYGAT